MDNGVGTGPSIADVFYFILGNLSLWSPGYIDNGYLLRNAARVKIRNTTR